MSSPIGQSLVEDFYFEVWNKRNLLKAKEILSDDFTFRGSLGDEKRGVAGFLDYVSTVHFALSNYECIIRDLVVTENKVAAQMLFKGVHQNPFFGVQATGKQIQWSGAAFFQIKQSRIAAAWVLGDIDAIKQQLAAGIASSSG